MRVIISLQREYRTLTILENDQGEPVASSNDPRLVTLDQLMEVARRFRDENPELFGEVKE